MANYYGERALAALKQAGEVVLNRNEHSLEGEELIAAAKDCDLIVSYRQSPGPGTQAEPGFVPVGTPWAWTAKGDNSAIASAAPKTFFCIALLVRNISKSSLWDV